MSCWHDPRGRLIVDGDGKLLRDGDEVRRLSLGSDGTRVADFGRFRRFSCDATNGCECVGLWTRYSAGVAFLPHSCRPERHQ